MNPREDNVWIPDDTYFCKLIGRLVDNIFCCRKTKLNFFVLVYFDSYLSDQLTLQLFLNAHLFTHGWKVSGTLSQL